jgi:hypothetical protein
MLAVIAYVLEQADFYHALNKETPDSLVQSLERALDDIKINGDVKGVSDYDKI